jgi:hypothetical protein
VSTQTLPAVAVAAIVVATALSIASAATAQGPQAGCLNWQYRAPGLPWSVRFAPSPPNCRALEHTTTEDVVNDKGQHFSSEHFSTVDRSDIPGFQLVAVLRPKGWTVGAEETLSDHRLEENLLKSVLGPGEKSPSVSTVHSVRISVDGLPGAELAGSLDVMAEGNENAAGTTRFISEYLIIDSRRNQAYLVAYSFAADRMAPLHHGFEGVERAFRFLDSFHVDR